MVYATYDYYLDSYGSNSIPEEIFHRLIRKASAYIDNFTFGRINKGNVDSFPSLPACACEMAEIIFFFYGEDGRGKVVKSENTDGYSVTYEIDGEEGQLHEERLVKKLYAIAKVYLLNTGLMYCGVDVC